MKEQKLSSGVQALINRLRDEGINDGRKAGDELIADAHKQAKSIIDDAQLEAEEIIRRARNEADHIKTSARDAVQLAARDTMLDLKSALVNQFSKRVSEFVSEAMTEEDFLQQLIIEIAGRIRSNTEGKRLDILLPKDVVGLDELRKHPEKVKEGGLGQFVLSLSLEILREGVEIKNNGRHKGGLAIMLVDDDVRIDLTDEVVSDLILEHLLPRFRALLEGSIQ